MIKALRTVGRYFMLMGRTFSRPERMRMFFRQYLNELEQLGVNSIGIVLLISFFIGAVITIQIKLNIESPWMPRWTVGYVTREIMLLEFSSSIMCLILAGKVGSNIASELGTMRVTQQIDALEIMGINSANYLILPKITAMVTVIPILVTFSIFAGIIGAFCTCWFAGVMNAVDLEYGLQYMFNEWFIWAGIIKSLFSSGAIAVGMGKAGLDKRPTETKKKQALAAIGQCELMFMYDKLFGEYNHSVAQLLLTRHAVETEQKRQNVINTIDELLRMNIIPVINENDTVTIDELEGNNFGDNDMLSAIVAGLVVADRLIILTDIDGLYDSNPRTNPNAKKLDIIEKINAEIFEMAAGTGSNRGTGGMITKLQAADYATKRGVEVSVINGSNPENLYEVIDGNKIGTKFLPVK